MSDVTVCIPTVPGREELLRRAVESAGNQTHPVRVHVAMDTDADGAATTRNRAWRDAEPTEWLAFLDDDDVMDPNHVELCLAKAHEVNADLVYPWFRIHDSVGNDISHNDPLRAPTDAGYVTPYGLTFDASMRTELLTRNNFIPVTVLVRRALVEQVDGFPIPGSPEWGDDCCEDWGLWRKLLRADAVFAHVPRRTWTWTWHSSNTSGKPWNGRVVERYRGP